MLRALSESPEVQFLEREREAILARWRSLTTRRVNANFFEAGEFFNERTLQRVYDEIRDAVSRNLYRDLNQTFDSIVRAGFEYSMTLQDAKGFVIAFGDAALEVLQERYGGDSEFALLRSRLKKMRRSLKSVYSERVARGSIEVLQRFRKELLARWRRELPTPIISDHFALLEEEDLQAFVEDTYEMYLRILSGEEEDEVSSEGETSRTVLEQYLSHYIEFFEPKGFAISDVQRAMTHLAFIAEPYLHKAFGRDAHQYRIAKLSLEDAAHLLSLRFSEAYNDRMMKNYYNEVSLMLHRIKNKLTAVPTTMQTILMTSEPGGVPEGDPMIVTSQDAALFNEYLRRVEEVAQAAESTLEGLLLAAEANPGHLDGEQVREGLRALEEPLNRWRSFYEEHQDDIERIKVKLDEGSIALLEELLQMVHEGGVLTQELTMELQIRQNELYRREPPRREPIPIYEMVSRAVHECEPEARSKNQNLIFRGEDQGIPIFGVRKEIYHPFVQVIENAIKYTPEGGTITVNLDYQDGEFVVFWVRDTGIGIPPGEEEVVFELANRCSNAKEFNRSGTGTGLYNDRKTILHHNGRIWAESEGVGKGTTFYIVLPIYHERIPS